MMSRRFILWSIPMVYVFSCLFSCKKITDTKDDNIYDGGGGSSYSATVLANLIDRAMFAVDSFQSISTNGLNTDASSYQYVQKIGALIEEAKSLDTSVLMSASISEVLPNTHYRYTLPAAGYAPPLSTSNTTVNSKPSFDVIKDALLRERFKSMPSNHRDNLIGFASYFSDSPAMLRYGSNYYYYKLLHKIATQELHTDLEASQSVFFATLRTAKSTTSLMPALTKFFNDMFAALDKMNTKFGKVINSYEYTYDYTPDIKTYDDRFEMLRFEGKIGFRVNNSFLDSRSLEFFLISEDGSLLKLNTFKKTVAHSGAGIYYLTGLNINDLENYIHLSQTSGGTGLKYGLLSRTSVYDPSFIVTKELIEQNINRGTLGWYVSYTAPITDLRQLFCEPNVITKKTSAIHEDVWVEIKCGYMPF